MRSLDRLAELDFCYLTTVGRMGGKLLSAWARDSHAVAVDLVY
jgi:hypothetical protein